MSDTPRTKDATFQVRSRGTPVPDDVTYASFAAGLERELAAANARIRRLEEAGDKLALCSAQLGWTSAESCKWIQKAHDALNEWTKTKETRP